MVNKEGEIISVIGHQCKASWVKAPFSKSRFSHHKLGVQTEKARLHLPWSQHAHPEQKFLNGLFVLVCFHFYCVTDFQ